jgi:hypothetical protein
MRWVPPRRRMIFGKVVVAGRVGCMVMGIIGYGELVLNYELNLGQEWGVRGGGWWGVCWSVA